LAATRKVVAVRKGEIEALLHVEKTLPLFVAGCQSEEKP
jgi:hypothetical protein